MPEHVESNNIAKEIEQLITLAGEYILIASPSVHLEEAVFIKLAGASARGVKIDIVTGNSPDPVATRLLSVIQNMTLTCVENMNACIYLNEKMMLLTSAGIDRISFQSDINTAVTFSAGDDCKIYNAIKTSIEKASLQGIKIMLQPGSDMQIISADKMYRGFCILCRMPVTFNASKPLCSMCSRTCDQAAINPGQFCHSCGTEVKVTMKDPLCGKCHIY